jgi:hypothetical protein
MTFKTNTTSSAWPPAPTPNETRRNSLRPAPSCHAIATSADRDAITAILVAAFQQDPVARWIFAEQVCHSRFPVLIAALGGAFAHDTAYYTTDYIGAALCLPPEIPSDEARTQILSSAPWTAKGV